MGAGSPADIRRAQSGQVPCSGARRRGKALGEVSAAIPRDAVARNVPLEGRGAFCRVPLEAVVGRSRYAAEKNLKSVYNLPWLPNSGHY